MDERGGGGGGSEGRAGRKGKGELRKSFTGVYKLLAMMHWRAHGLQIFL